MKPTPREPPAGPEDHKQTQAPFYFTGFFHHNTHNTEIISESFIISSVFFPAEISDVFLLHSSKGNVRWLKEDRHISIRTLLLW